MALALPKSKLYEANASSAAAWQADLIKLFHHAKERYADVVWELVSEEETEGEEVWGHKAIVYARAPTSFQALYFSFRPAPSATPDFYGDDIGPDESSFSLQLDPPSPVGSLMRDTMNAMRAASPSPSQAGGILRLTTSINPALFANELEYLYTAQGMGEAFEFLFDAPENRDYHESEDNRRDKLRKDLCYMWRARLFSDVRIALTGDFRPPDALPDAEDTAVVFFSHRFILVSRSPYFHKVLQSNFQPPTAPLDGTMMTLQLPPTAFTPASLHWALGFMYAGTLNFSHRTFDLDTAFAIVRSAAYLLMNTMSAEIEAHIVEEMLHGLFHAYLTFDEYEKITAGKWGVGGCRCRQCQRRVPRVLEFSLSPDISNKILERGSRRALVGMFGEGWCSSEFAGLSTKMRALLLKGVQTRTTPQNIFPLIFAAEAALAKLDIVNDQWRDTVHELIMKARKTIDECLDDQAETAFEQQEWLEIMDSDGAQFQDMDRVTWTMDSVLRGLKDTNAPLVYQVLVSSILLRAHPTETTATLLPNTSPVRAKVEDARKEVIRWLKKHWIQVRLVGGFDALDPWALKEISHELEMNIPDLLAPANAKGPTTRTGLQVTMPRDRAGAEAEEASISATSMRASVLNRNLAKSNATRPDDTPRRDPLPPVRISLQSRNRDTTTDNDTHSLATSFSSAQSGLNQEASSVTSAAIVTQKLTGATFSRSNTLDSATTSANHRTEPAAASPARSVPARRNVKNDTTAASDSPAAGRPKSIAASVKSTTSTIRRGGASTTNTAVSPVAPSPNVANNTLKVKAEPRRSTAATSTTAGASRSTPRASLASNLSRPSSRVSDVSTSFKSAKSELDIPAVPRPRATSMASTTSNRSMKTDGGSTSGAGRTAGKTRGNLVVSTPRALRPRKTSDASVISTASLSSPRGNVTPKRPSSQASVRSTASTRSVSVKRQTPTKPTEKVPDVPKRTAKVSLTGRAPGVKKPTTVAPPTPSPVPVPTPAPVVVATPPSTKEALKDEPVSAPAVIIRVDDEGPEIPQAPPVPPKEGKRDTAGSLSGGLMATSTKDKRPSATSTMSTNSESTIRLTRKRSNDTITGTEDVSTLRAGALAKLIGTSGSPTKPSAVDVLSLPAAGPSRIVAPPVVPPAIVPAPVAAPISHDLMIPYSTAPNGITLNVGIPCIITSKRARFRAFARYLGEIVGERGPWIGVEVPLSEFPGLDKLEGRDWHDGSWNGIRYFEISGSGWEDERASRRRRMDPFAPGWRSRKDVDSLSVDQRSNRRMRSVSPAPSEGSTYESRGLFVRPQQVLYVVDARADY